MKILFETFEKTGTIHHAYAIEGEREAVYAALADFLEKTLGVPTRGNPDFWHSDFDTFTVDDGRALTDMQLRRSMTGGRKVFVVKANSMTVEAQNSLLKAFEEPTEGTHFFLVLPSVERLLPTLRSRLVEIRHDLEDTIDRTKAARDFLGGSPKKRADMIKRLIDEKDKTEAARFLKSVEAAYRGTLDLAKASERQIFALEEIGKAIRYLDDRSPSVKQLLEHVAGIVPVI